MSSYAVTNNQQITQSTQLVTLQHVSGKPLLFEPGQYAAIHGYRHGRPMPIRCFSIVSSPTEQDILQFSMRVKGKFTHAISGLQKGDKVHVQGPYGGFVLNTHNQKRIVMLAGGIGITPFISMIRFASITKADTDVELVYSVAKQTDMPFSDELTNWDRYNPNFKYNLVVSDGPIDKIKHNRVFQGRITPEVLEKAVGAIYGDVETQFYICGPPPFMNAMLAMLLAHGVAKSRIMTEAFSQGPNRQTGKIRDWPFSMYALGALGLSAGSMAVMVSDLGKLVPAKNSLQTAPNLQSVGQSNNRQSDLVALVNSFPASSSDAPASRAVKKALAAAKKPTQSSTVASSGSTSSSSSRSTTSSSSSSSSSSTGSSTSGSTTTSTPPTPVCTTNQSGVTTCN
ncbi:hypothetical protein KDA23_05930 [Candidatus Saccharibacteria bacterium]|nr:hypothetical protein [Candidatus Saccharibacteria bacterium]